ncbi:MAG: sigma-70 family RNA polymerase sigma factor [Armatimonadetes bacterium]|nr:sigma-70 family RNA polymerase sigma factor [Armatimonadota bacterium]
MTDEEIVKQVQDGDRRLFAELHRRHYQKVWRFARRSLLDAEAANDIASDTFLRAYGSIDRFRVRRDGGFLSFLFRIASNLMADRARRLSHGATVSLDDEDDWANRLPDDEPAPLEQFLHQERIARVRDALTRLSVADRQILLLAYEQGLSAKEVAQVMGKPSVTAVTSHLHRALTKLRQLLSTDDYFSVTADGGDSHVAHPSNPGSGG